MPSELVQLLFYSAIVAHKILSAPHFGKDSNSSVRNLHEELKKIDQELSKLEERRTEIINRMSGLNRPTRGSSTVLYFPNGITISESPINCAEKWPIRPETKSTDGP
jgi:hypothetical protein